MAENLNDDVTEVAEEILGRFDTAVHTAAVQKVGRPGGIAGVFHAIRLGIERVTDVTGALTWILAWVVFLLGLFNVVTRYLARFIERDIIVNQMFDLQWMLFGALFLLGFNYAVREDVNPRIDFWWTNFSLKTKAWIDLSIHALLFLPFLWVATTVMYPYAMTAMGRNFAGEWTTWRVWEIWEQSGDAGGLPRGPIKLMMLLGFIFFASQIVAQMIKSLFILMGRPELADLAEHQAPRRVE